MLSKHANIFLLFLIFFEWAITFSNFWTVDLSGQNILMYSMDFH